MDPSSSPAGSLPDEGFHETEIPKWMQHWDDERRAEFAFQLLSSVSPSVLSRFHARITPMVMNRDFVQLLPYELSIYILSYVSLDTLLNVSLVSKSWYRASQDKALWKRLYMEQGWSYNKDMVDWFIRASDQEQLLRQKQLMMTVAPTSVASSSSASSSDASTSAAAFAVSAPSTSHDMVESELSAVAKSKRKMEYVDVDTDVDHAPSWTIIEGFDPTNPEIETILERDHAAHHQSDAAMMEGIEDDLETNTGAVGSDQLFAINATATDVEMEQVSIATPSITSAIVTTAISSPSITWGHLEPPVERRRDATLYFGNAAGSRIANGVSSNSNIINNGSSSNCSNNRSLVSSDDARPTKFSISGSSFIPSLHRVRMPSSHSLGANSGMTPPSLRRRSGPRSSPAPLRIPNFILHSMPAASGLARKQEQNQPIPSSAATPFAGTSSTPSIAADNQPPQLPPRSTKSQPPSPTSPTSPSSPQHGHAGIGTRGLWNAIRHGVMGVSGSSAWPSLHSHKHFDHHHGEDGDPSPGMDSSSSASAEHETRHHYHHHNHHHSGTSPVSSGAPTSTSSGLPSWLSHFPSPSSPFRHQRGASLPSNAFFSGGNSGSSTPAGSQNGHHLHHRHFHGFFPSSNTSSPSPHLATRPGTEASPPSSAPLAPELSGDSAADATSPTSDNLPLPRRINFSGLDTPPPNQVLSPNLLRIHTCPETGKGQINWKHLYQQKQKLNNRWSQGLHETRDLSGHKELPGHKEGIYCIQFDDQKIISGSRDKNIKIWDLSTGHCLRTYKGHEASVLCLHYDENRIVSGSSDMSIIVWDLETGEIVRRLDGHRDSVLSLRFEDDTVVSCSKDRTVKIWNVETGRTLRTLVGHRAAVNAVQFSPAKKSAVMRGTGVGGFGNSTSHGLHAQDYNEIRQDENMLEPALPADRIVVSASGDRSIKIWSFETGDCLRTLEGHSRGIACIQFEGRIVVSGSSDRSIKVWDVITGECIQTLNGHTDLVRTLQFSGGRIISGGYDETLKIWDQESGSLLADLRGGHTHRVFKLQFNETKIVSCSQDQTIIIWDFSHGVDSTFLC